MVCLIRKVSLQAVAGSSGDGGPNVRSNVSEAGVSRNVIPVRRWGSITIAPELNIRSGSLLAAEPAAHQQMGLGAWLRVRAPPGSAERNASN